MKSTLLFSLTLIFFATTANGQGEKYQRRYIHQTSAGEVKFGPVINGYGLGVFGEYKLTDQVGLQSGLLYEIKLPGFFSSHDYHYMIYYLSLPVTFRYYVGEKKRCCWLGGLRGRYFLAGAKKYPKYLTLNLKEVGGGEKASSYDVSIDVGLDYENSFGLVWGFAYSQGLRNAVEGPKSFKNMSLEIKLGYNLAKLMQ
ncbi:MAG: outer membrane beta-barrel protein [Bacteroidota bacterium]